MIRILRALEARPISTRFGLGLAVVTAVVSGVSVFLNATAVRSVGDPVLFTTLKNGVAAAILLALAGAAIPAAPRVVRRLDRRSLLGLLALGVIVAASRSSSSSPGSPAPARQPRRSSTRPSSHGLRCWRYLLRERLRPPDRGPRRARHQPASSSPRMACVGPRSRR